MHTDDEDDTIFTSLERLDKNEAVDRLDLMKKFEGIPLGTRHVKQITKLVRAEAKTVVEDNTVRLKERVGELELTVSALEKKMDLKDQAHDHQLQLLEQRINEKISAIKLVGSVVGIILTALGIGLPLLRNETPSN